MVDWAQHHTLSETVSQLPPAKKDQRFRTHQCDQFSVGGQRAEQRPKTISVPRHCGCKLHMINALKKKKSKKAKKNGKRSA